MHGFKGDPGTPRSPSATWYAAMSRLLIAAATGIYPRQKQGRARDLQLVREMLALSEKAVAAEPPDTYEEG